MTTAVIFCNPTRPARIDYLRQTLASLQAHLRCHDSPLTIHCAVEGDSFRQLAEADRRQLVEFLSGCQVPIRFRDGQPNFGAHLNAVLRSLAGQHVLVVPEDWQLRGPLDLGRDIDLFDRHPLAGYVRYVKADSVIKGFFERYYLWPEPDRFPYYSHTPHLRRAGIDNWVGEVPEQLDHFEAEVAMSRQVARTPVKVFLRPDDAFENLGIVSSLPPKDTT